MPERLRTCDHCGRRVSSRGPRSASGIYFCMDQECRAAKARAERRRAATEKVKEAAPTKCSGCGCELEPRPHRVGDDPRGRRWCEKRACRIAREVADREIRVSFAMAQEATERIEFLQRALLLPRVSCPDCGEEEAVEGYRHLDDFGRGCNGVGTRSVKVHDAAAVWPTRVDTRILSWIEAPAILAESND